MTQLGESALDDPAVPVAPQRAAILGPVLGSPDFPVGRDHFDAQIEEQLIERIAVVGFVAEKLLCRFGAAD